MELKINKINNWFRSVTDSTNDFGSFSQGSNPCGTAKVSYVNLETSANLSLNLQEMFERLYVGL